MEDFRKDVEARLKRLPPRFRCAYATRCAIHSVMGLSYRREEKQDFLWFWETKKREKFQYNTLNALVVALNVSAGNVGAAADAYVAAADAYVAADDAYDYATYDYAASDAAYAAADTATAAADDTAATAAAAAAAAVRSLSALSLLPTEKFHGFFLDELTYLESIDKSDASAANPIVSFLARPLWSGLAEAELLKQPAKQFVQDLRNFGQGFDFWADWYQERLDGKPLDLDLQKKIVFVPDEVKAGDVASLNAYLKRLRAPSSDLRPLNRVRVIFIGFGETGKSSLIDALNDRPVREGEKDMTPGIDIEPWPVQGSDITALFWDFGGQVMAHATHQFFLRSRCLYVLLLSGRSETDANDQAEYWLEHVRAFGKDAPVMIVGNKWDLCPVNIDNARLQEKHPNIVGFYPLSCTEYKTKKYHHYFERFRVDFIQQLQTVGTHQVQFLPNHFEVLQAVERLAKKDSFLDKSDFQTLCSQKDVAAKGAMNRDWLLGLLDKLGVVLHFPELASLDAYILNPRWLTYGVYAIIYSDEAKERKGKLEEQLIYQVLQRETIRARNADLSYPGAKCGVIIEAMEQFKLCYRLLLPERSTIIIPQLLDTDRPEHGFDKSDALAFQFDFKGFLPRHVMPMLIVERHEEIADEKVWQHGVYLRRPDGRAEALFEADSHERRLSMWVSGLDASDYFKVLHDAAKRIINRMDIHCDEWIAAPESARLGEAPLLARNKPARIQYSSLLACQREGHTKYPTDSGSYSVARILKLFPVMTEAQPAVMPEPFHVPWYRQWWLVSLVVGVLAGLGAGIYTGSLELGLSGGVIAMIATWLFNPHRRFFRMAQGILAGLVLATVMDGLNAKLSFLEDQDNKAIELFFNLGVSQNPLLGLGLVGLAGLLVYLDSRQR